MKMVGLIGRILVGLSYGIYGYLHFAHAEADAAIVPSFAGNPLFWVYFIGVCWFAVALSFISNIMTRLSGILASVVLIAILLSVQLPHFKGVESMISLASTLALIGASWYISSNGVWWGCCCKKEQMK